MVSVRFFSSQNPIVFFPPFISTNGRSIILFFFFSFFWRTRATTRKTQERRAFFYVLFSFPPFVNKDRRILAARDISNLWSIVFQIRAGRNEQMPFFVVQVVKFPWLGYVVRGRSIETTFLRSIGSFSFSTCTLVTDRFFIGDDQSRDRSVRWLAILSPQICR